MDNYHRRLFYVLFISLPLPLQPPDILAEEGQDLVLPLQTGQHGPAVAAADLLRRQIGADDGGALFHQPPVDDLVQGALDEGGGHLCTQIVQNQQVTCLLYTSDAADD